MTTNDKIHALRLLMQKNNVDAYIIVTDDFHASEYVGDYFKAREYMSGFTGSAGTLVVLKDTSALWTDGRYFIQAEEQLRYSEITLMKSGNEGVQSIPDFLFDKLNENETIAFDGRTINNFFYNELKDRFQSKNIIFKWDIDLINEIWTDRPSLPDSKIWELDVKYTGTSRVEKISKVRSAMKSEEADCLILTALDEIAWMLNLRGFDINCTPVFLSYMIIEDNTATLFVHSKKLSTETQKKLNTDGISVKDYNQIYKEIEKIDNRKKIWIDSRTANCCIFKSLHKSTKIMDKESPVILLKAIKNECEMNNIRKAHILDAVAVNKFIYWLKTNVSNFSITELDASNKLEEFRKECSSYIETSFDSIIAYGEHGAIIHYEPTEQTNIVMQPKSFCLADVGGHYFEGTTDVTRAIALGPIHDDEKKAYTLVLKGHLNLSDATFPYGICGENLDYLARAPLWKNALDYNHGTGHGVGYILNVHEGPQTINWNINRRKKHYILEEGMIISNEPGVYFKNEFGIRLENLIMVRKGLKNEFGQFMHFENLTMIPFDSEAIDPSLLTEHEIELLNQYHQQVYTKISPYLNMEERKWLKKSTERIKK